MKRTSLYGDIRQNPRATEGSNVVASKWGATVDPYLPEIPDVKPENVQCRESYFNITAERILFRKKLLGLPVDENLGTDANILMAHPFGEANPTFGELAVASVRLAAAFVPLTPDENDVTLRPVMARLYCIAGLPGRYTLPFTEGLTEAGIQNYNWFVAGVKDDALKMGISGRSWLLAANLLMRVVERNDVATARNLINNFIVTGNVEDGAISHVTIGRKPELARKVEFRNFRWIVPIKNREEVKIMKAECPETLEAAYELIQTMRSHATNALIKAVQDNVSSDTLGDILKIGANPSQTDSDSGANARQALVDMMAENIYRIRSQVLKIHKGIDTNFVNACFKDLMEYYERFVDRDRMMSYYGCHPQMFFLLAKAGMHDMVDKLAGLFDINATDSKGETALDLAEEIRDESAKSILIQAGAHRRGIFEPGSLKMKSALADLYSQDDVIKAKAVQHIKIALESSGRCSPNLVIDLNPSQVIRMEEEWTEEKPLYRDENEFDEDDPESTCFNPYAVHDSRIFISRRRRYSTTIFAEAVCSENQDLIKVCLSHGGDVDIPITCLRITKLWKETFARSGKSEVIHPCNFDEFNDSCPRYTTTIRNLINSCCKFSYNIRKLMSDYMNTQVKAKKTILSDGNCTVTNV